MTIPIQWSLSWLVVLACTLSTVAEFPKRALAALEVRTYCVADLMIPPGESNVAPILHLYNAAEFARTRSAQSIASDDALIAYVTHTVRPDCWTVHGGNCSLQYVAEGMSIVVTAPADIHHDVAGALATMRKQLRPMKLETSLVEMDENGKKQKKSLPTVAISAGPSAAVEQSLVEGSALRVSAAVRVQEDGMIDVCFEYRDADAGASEGEDVYFQRLSCLVRPGERARLAIQPARDGTAVRWLDVIVREDKGSGLGYGRK
jgi:hypothetical protein